MISEALTSLKLILRSTFISGTCSEYSTRSTILKVPQCGCSLLMNPKNSPLALSKWHTYHWTCERMQKNFVMKRGSTSSIRNSKESNRSSNSDVRSWYPRSSSSKIFFIDSETLAFKRGEVFLSSNSPSSCGTCLIFVISAIASIIRIHTQKQYSPSEANCSFALLRRTRIFLLTLAAREDHLHLLYSP